MKKPIIEGNSIKIPSSQDYLPDVDEFVEAILIDNKVDKSIVADIAISVTEMVINCIVHGNKSDIEKTVSVKVVKDNGEVTVSISDEGAGFNPEKVENPIEDKNLLREVGRGIFITKSLMDSVSFEPVSGGGTKVILKKLI
ncbi:MAG: ATP-binding protein [Candidatus Zixiibacteriota bacterium]